MYRELFKQFVNWNDSSFDSNGSLVLIVYRTEIWALADEQFI